MGAYTGLSKGDVLKFPWSACDGRDIRQGKNDDNLWIPEHSELKKVLDQTPRRGTIVVLNTQGKPYTGDGFSTEFRKIKNKLLRERKIGEGLTFPDLRHTVATKLADAGATTRTIQSITGHKTPEQVETYVATVNKKRLAKKGMALIDGNKRRK